MESKEMVAVNSQVSLQDMKQMADAMAKSRLFPSCQTPENALALMLLCQSEGIHPAQAVRRFHVIKGTCSMRADAMLAEFQRQGGKIQWLKFDATEAKAIFEHAQGGKVEFAYTHKEAEQAGLVRSESNWTKFPAAMLRARCISGGIRMVLPGVVCGIYTPEEVSDFDIPAEKPKKQTAQNSKHVEAEVISSPKTTIPKAETPQISTDVTPKAETPKEPPTPPVSDQTGKEVAEQLKKIREGAVRLGCKTVDDIRKFVGGLLMNPREITSVTVDLTSEERAQVLEVINAEIARQDAEAANG